MSLPWPRRTHRVPSFLLALAVALSAALLGSASAEAVPRTIAAKQGIPQALARGLSWTVAAVT